MSDLQDIIATTSIRAFKQGMQHEREHIIQLLAETKEIAGYEQGVQAEQERIIKLLESPEVRAEWIEATSNALPTYQGVVDFFTAKIKGEQK